MVRTGVAFDWPSRYVEDEPAAGTSMPCRRTLTWMRPRSTVIVSPSVTPTTFPVKSSARAGDAHLLPPCPATCSESMTRYSLQPKLARHEEPDIDQFVPKVEQAMRAYVICKERLDAMQATLGQHLQPRDGTSAAAAGAGSRRRPRGDRDGNAGDNRDRVDIPY
jgi:hypothetical protein